MPLDILKNIADQKPAGVALLGMDVGRKTIGLALSNPEQSMVTPLETIRRTKLSEDVIKLDAVIRAHQIGGFVIGYPINMDGSLGPRAQSVKDFAWALLEYPDIFGVDPWIALADERLSTHEAHDLLADTHLTSKKAKARGHIDALAAAKILEGVIA